MTTSRVTGVMHKPVAGDPIPVGTFGYLRARNKARVYELVLKEFQRSKVSQADLARRMNKGSDAVCRLLSAPGNWTLDTISDLLFAISGAEPQYGLAYPLDQPSRNFTHPDWMSPVSSASRPTANSSPATFSPSTGYASARTSTISNVTFSGDRRRG